MMDLMQAINTQLMQFVIVMTSMTRLLISCIWAGLAMECFVLIFRKIGDGMPQTPNDIFPKQFLPEVQWSTLLFETEHTSSSEFPVHS